MARWLRECFSWQFQDVLFHKGAPFWHVCLKVCVHVCLEILFILLRVSACITCLIHVCTWVIFDVYALFCFPSASTINKVCWKEDRCSVHYVISLDHTSPVLTLRPPKNLTCQPRKRDKEDTESITTPISTSCVSHPNIYHITDLLAPPWHHLHFRFQVKHLLWVVNYSFTLILFLYLNPILLKQYLYV